MTDAWSEHERAFWYCGKDNTVAALLQRESERIARLQANVNQLKGLANTLYDYASLFNYEGDAVWDKITSLYNETMRSLGGVDE